MRARRAVFLDRDGTIIVDKNYLKYPSDVELLPGAKRGIDRLKEDGHLIFLFSNQSGIARGFLTLEDVVTCNKKMLSLLGYGDELFEEICIAPEAPNAPRIYRKPSPKFILECIKKYELEPKNCYMLGDKESDILAGINAKINSVLITLDENFRHEMRCKYPNILTKTSILEFSET